MYRRAVIAVCLLATLAVAGGCAGMQERAMHNSLLDQTPVAAGAAQWERAEPPAARSIAAAPPRSPDSPDADRPAEDGQTLDIRAADLAGRRMLVYVAEYFISVTNPDGALAEVSKLADELGGYIHSRTGERIVIRVPADRFRPATDRIERLGLVTARTINAKDVTEEHVDLKMRLASNQAMLARLTALLERTQDIKAMLEIEREIGRIITEIERLQGNLRLLENRAAYSTISVQFSRLADAPRQAARVRRLPVHWLRSLGLNQLLDY